MTANGRTYKALGRAACFAALAAGALWLAGQSVNPGRAADKGDTPPKAAADLDAVPADGVAMISVRVGDLLNHAAFKGAREKLAKDAPDVVERLTNELGVAPEDIERYTAVVPSVGPPPAWLGFVTTVKPYDAKKVAAALAPDGQEEKVNGKAMTVGGHGSAVAFVSDRTYVYGPAEDVRKQLKRGDNKEGPLTPALREAGGKHVVVAGIDVETLAKAAPAEPPPDAAALKPLLKAKDALLTVDLGDEVKADLRVTFAGEAEAKHGEEAVNAGLDLARAALVARLNEVEKQRELAGVVDLMKNVQAGMRAAKVGRDGATVTASGVVKLDTEKTGAALLDAVQKVREASARIQSANNLKQLALAMHNYHDATGHFPPAAVYDKNGKPLLSWRVLLLPYLDQNTLYQQFKLDEPWDSDNNKKLLEKMPAVFAAPMDEQALKNHETHYQGFVGKGSIFDGKKGVSLTDITDGTSNTIMFAEAGKAVPWTKPDDLAFEGKLLPKVGGLFPNIFQAAMCDGSVRGIPMSIKEETLRAAITRNGGEVLGPDW